MMESTNLHEALISPPAPSSPSRTAASGSDDKKNRGPPPVDNANAAKKLPPSSPSRAAASYGDDGDSDPSSPSRAADGPNSSYSPPPPPVVNGKAAKNLDASFSPPPAASDGDESSSDADMTPHRLPPPSPSRAGDGTGPSYSPSPPAMDNAKHPAASFPSPPAASDGDKGSRDRTKPPSTSASQLAALDPNAPSTSRGLQVESRSPLPTSPAAFSSSPPSRRWWNLRERAPRLPVYAPAPPPGRRFNWFHSWRETNRPRAPRVIGIFGFSLFGSISLLPSTMDRVKELSDVWKIIVMLSFGIIWVLSSVAVLCGLHGKSNFEQAVCRHTGRLGMLGLALLVILHVRWALPAGTGYDAGFYLLLLFAALLHFSSWVASCLVGEDRIVDAAPVDAQQ